MDLRDYYRKVREVEAAIAEKDAVIVSEATPDGGLSGVMSEVPKVVAARLVASGKARLATAEEAAQHIAALVSDYRAAEEARRMARPALAVLSEGELKYLTGALKKEKPKG